jgi:hypothetical protein
MQVSPSLDMTVGRYGVWQAGVLALAGLAAAATLAWWLAAPAASPAALALGLVFAAGCIVASTTVAFRHRGVRLRWDGQRWSMAPLGSGDEPTPIEPPTVALDFGVWMLLRLRCADASPWRGGDWRPIQRRGHEPHWHALRCAVYSPRPILGDPPPASPRPSPNECP